jgi:uncharacterized protein
MLKKYLISQFLFILLCSSVNAAQWKFPPPKGAVNDFAGVIESPYAKQMEDLSREVLEKTGTAIVVAVMDTIGDNDPADYANRLYQAWGIGEKGKDKGVLFFLAMKERKFRIETGYGVEGILPDGLVGEIRDRYVTPYLKDGQYGKGLANVVMAVASLIAKDARVDLTGAPTPSQPQKTTYQRGRPLFTFILLIVALALLIGTRQGRDLLPVILLMLMGGGRGGGSGDRNGDGGFGGFGGGFGGFGGGSSGGGGAGGDF